MKTEFKRKVVVITGATGGIGRCLALRFASARARLVLLDLDPLQLSALVNQVEKLGADALGLQCDVTDEEQCDNAIKRAVAEFGGVDVLINNAGITHNSTFVETSRVVFQRVMDVNFFGSLNCTRAALPYLLENRGTVITLSSLAGFTPQYGHAAYAASKHALHGLFESLRAEEPQLHVMIVVPSTTDTDLNRNALRGDGSITSAAQVITGKVASPADVAEQIYKGALRKKQLLVLMKVSWASRFISLLFPRAFQRKLANRVKKLS